MAGSDEPDSGNRETRPLIPRAVHAGARILVVEDEEIVRRYLHRGLTHAGYEVLTAADGQEGLEAYQLAPVGIDLLILDHHLPRLSGGELLDRVRALRPNQPVLRVSADHKLPERIDAWPGRSAPLLLKPFSVEQLLDAVAGALRKD